MMWLFAAPTEKKIIVAHFIMRINEVTRPGRNPRLINFNRICNSYSYYMSNKVTIYLVIRTAYLIKRPCHDVKDFESRNIKTHSLVIVKFFKNLDAKNLVTGPFSILIKYIITL
jgi:hypothetical protein